MSALLIFGNGENIITFVEDTAIKPTTGIFFSWNPSQIPKYKCYHTLGALREVNGDC